MEWFRRPDGSVAVSEWLRVHQGLSSRPCMDTCTAWTCTAPGPSWSSSAGSNRDRVASRPGRCIYAAWAGAGCGPFTGPRDVQRELGDVIVESRLPQPGQPASSTYLGEGYVMVRHPETAVVRDALDASSCGSGWSWWRRCERHHDLARLSGRDVVLHASVGAVGATVIGVGDQPRDALPPAAREGLAHYESGCR